MSPIFTILKYHVWILIWAHVDKPVDWQLTFFISDKHNVFYQLLKWKASNAQTAFDKLHEGVLGVEAIDR